MVIRAYFDTVKDQFWQAIRRGESKKCPCCGQNAKVYHRTINEKMARTLFKMWWAAGTDPAHVPSPPGDPHEASQLSWWGLIEDEGKVREDGGRAGWWYLTPKGVEFLKGWIKIPSHAWVYDGECEGLDSDRLLHIDEALGEKFNRAQLLNDNKMPEGFDE